MNKLQRLQAGNARLLHVLLSGLETYDALECKPYVEVLLDKVRQEERERCARVAEGFARHYPEVTFIPPPPGQHGKTVDACSAAAIRGICPSIAVAIREAPTT